MRDHTCKMCVAHCCKERAVGVGKTSRRPPQLPRFTKHDESMTSLMLAGPQAAARGCMQTRDNNVVQESPERFSKRSKGRLSAKIVIYDIESEFTPPLG